MQKGETLIDTAMTLNAMHVGCAGGAPRPIRAPPKLLSEKVNCSVINAGDGQHEHPTQALLDALTIRRRKGRLDGLTVAICGDVLHSRVARSNIHLLNTMGATCAPGRRRAPCCPARSTGMGVEVFHDMRQGPEGRGHRHDAARAERAHGRQLHPLHPRNISISSAWITKSCRSPNPTR